MPVGNPLRFSQPVRLVTGGLTHVTILRAVRLIDATHSTNPVQDAGMFPEIMQLRERERV